MVPASLVLLSLVDACKLRREVADGAFKDNFMQLYNNREPVIVSGLTSRWPQWPDEDTLLAQFGDLEVSIAPAKFAEETGKAATGQEHMQLRQYMMDGHAMNKTFFARDSPLVPHIRRLVIPEMPLQLLVSSEFVLSFGHGGRGLGMHRHDQNWLAQLRGRKTWILDSRGKNRPKREWTQIEPCSLLDSMDRYPELDACTLGEGEVLYLPALVWHATCNKDKFTMAFGGRGWSGDAPPLIQASRLCAMRDAKKAWKERGGSRDTVAQIALYYAAKMNCSTVVGYLSGKGIPATWREPESTGFMAIHVATRAGHLGVMEALIQHGAERRATQDGQSLVHLAAAAGHLPALTFLAQQGQALDTEDRDKNQPLHLAASAGHQAIMEFLVAHGAKETLNLNGRSPAELLSQARKAIEDPVPIELDREEL